MNRQFQSLAINKLIARKCYDGSHGRSAVSSALMELIDEQMIHVARVPAVRDGDYANHSIIGQNRERPPDESPISHVGFLKHHERNRFIRGDEFELPRRAANLERTSPVRMIYRLEANLRS